MTAWAEGAAGGRLFTVAQGQDINKAANTRTDKY